MLAADYQQALTGLDGIDLIPAQWLHLTMQGIGFTDEITADEPGHLDHALTARRRIPRPDHPAGRGLLQSPPRRRAHPASPPMHDAVLSVFGSERFTETPADLAKYLPHVSIGYITYDGDPALIAVAR